MTTHPDKYDTLSLGTLTDADDAVSGLTELARGWTPTGTFWSVESCLETMRSGPCRSGFANEGHDQGKNWVGWYLATRGDTDCELLFIWIEPEFRGKGIASRLLRRLIQSAGGLSGLQNIFLEVRPSNQDAVSLYERHGFQKQSIRARYYSNGEDALVYRLEL